MPIAQFATTDKSLSPAELADVVRAHPLACLIPGPHMAALEDLRERAPNSLALKWLAGKLGAYLDTLQTEPADAPQD